MRDRDSTTGQDLPQRLADAARLREQGELPAARQALEAILAAEPRSAAALADLVQVQAAQGDLAAAQASARRLADLAPDSGPALRSAARIALRAGRGDEALQLARSAVAAGPDDADSGAFLASALLARGALDEAAAQLDRTLARDPGHAGARTLRAEICARKGDARGAAAALEAALAAKPHLPLWQRLGRLRLAMNDAERARAAFARALDAQPGDAASSMGLAEALRRLDRPAEAEAQLRAAVARDPQNAGLWSNLGVVLTTQSRRRDAAEALRRATALDPQAYGAHLNLVTVLSLDGAFAEAEASARAAVALRPDLAAAFNALGGVLEKSQRSAEAEGAYRRALELDPAAGAAQEGLARCLADRGETAEAARLLEDLGRRTGALEQLLRAAMLQPVIPASVAEIDAARARCAEALARARRSDLRFRDPAGAPLSFYLAYQGRDDRPLMESLDAVLREKAPQLSYASVAGPPPPSGRRARIGFVSQFLHGHTVGRVFKGLLQQLDRAAFEVVVAHLPASRRDTVRQEIDRTADLVIELPAELPAQRRALEAARLDLLFFTDVGMTAPSYDLARSRLAPVQAVGWGHPDTSGLRTLDYFVSWDLAEPKGAEAHYSERLVRLPRLACYYEPPTPPAPIARGAAGLPASGALYGCLQSPFKLHPDFDPVLAGIVQRDPAGWLVFAQGAHPAWETLLRRRWAAWPGLNARAVFLPRRPMETYLATLAAMDVLLDPPHFGSGNTFYDAMASGVPVVTWPGAFARGRIVSAAYAQMGAGAELVAASLDDYAALAVQVARSPAAETRAALHAAAQAELFCDLKAVRAFERFLLDAVAAGPPPPR